MLFWNKKNRNTYGVKHIEDYKIGEKVEVSVFKFSKLPKPASPINYKKIKKK